MLLVLAACSPGIAVSSLTSVVHARVASNRDVLQVVVHDGCVCALGKHASLLDPALIEKPIPGRLC